MEYIFPPKTLKVLIQNNLEEEEGTIKMDTRKTDFEDRQWIEEAWKRFHL